MTKNPQTSRSDLDRAAATVTLEARPERRLIRRGLCRRHIDYTIRVSSTPDQPETERTSMNLALVLDRSGSMQGAKLETAKRAVLAVLDRLEVRDQLAVVAFDDQIDLLQAAAPATDELKSRVRTELEGITARARTALHEGWLTGCDAIASDAEPLAEDGRLARCFLLTDGLANVGLRDPEKMAAEAAGVREEAGIGTSTFGIGADYSEAMLGPMASAGGGQFHHLRDPEDIANTFVGELGDLLSVAARRVRLELEADPGIEIEVVSEYWVREISEDRSRWSITIGDLLGGEERQVVVRCHFPGGRRQQLAVRGQVVWDAADGPGQSTEWAETKFERADHHLCEQEESDPAVVHWVGLHHAARARRLASQARGHFERREARAMLREVANRIAKYADSDQDLRDAVRALRAMERELKEGAMDSMMAKEAYFQTQRLSRGQKDYRSRQ